MAEKRITVWVQRFKDRPHLVLQWLDPDTGKRKSKSAETADPKEAEARRQDLEYELTHGKYQEASRMTWERFRELFEAEYYPNCRENTRQCYTRTFDLFEEICGTPRLKSVSERTASTFAAGLRARPGHGRPAMAPGTVKVHLQFLHTALKWAVGQKMLPACPKFPSVKVPKKRPQPIPAESFERLLAKAPDATMRGYLLCGWLAGLRLAEAIRLEWEPTEKAPYLDLARGRLVLPAELVKSVEDQWVPLDAQLTQALKAIPQHGAKVFRFVTKRGRPITESSIGGRVIRLAKQAGVKLTMKSLRKGFGCRYAGKVSAHVLQRLMRHADIKTTMAYYANIDAAVEEAVKGPECNTLRNSDDDLAGHLTGQSDAKY